METTKFIWKNGEMLPWEQAMTHVLTHTLHYGAAAFEGVRAYETPKGTAIFRLQEHTDRLFYSAKVIGMEVPYSKEEINEATKKVVRENEVEACYIRPIFYYGYGKMGLNPIGAPIDAVIACWPWGKYLPVDVVNVKISDFIRIHPKTGVTDAKISGHYVNSIMACLEIAKDEYFHEALFLDYEGNIAEGPGENFFIVKNGVIYTPPLGNILAGITRSSIMEVARDLGYTVEEKVLKPEDAWGADEAFFTGTAAEVTAIGTLDRKQIADGKMGPITTQIKETYLKAIRGGLPQYEKWLTYINA